jgi:ABC-type lipoprotein release transport system permease subunit
MIQLIKMAWRDLGRNRRRSFFSALAVGIALMLLLFLAAFIQGEMSASINTSIRLQSGHLQVRAQSYDEVKTSLKWADLIENPQALADQIGSIETVQAATPRLYASGILAVGDETAGVRVMGIDPLSTANQPYSDGMLEGSFLTPDDREGLLMGQALALRLGVKAGDPVNLSVNTSNGEVSEQSFFVRGVYTTQTYGFDSVVLLLPLSKAQSISQAENHASTIFVMLKDIDQVKATAAALQSSQYKVLTYIDMNELLFQFEQMANSYMVFFYLIVLGIAATVIVNTLIMSVFERTREIGILTAIGMRSRRIMAMFLTESTLLAFGGIILGLLLGGTMSLIVAKFGVPVGQMKITGFIFNDRIFPELTLKDTVNLSLMTLIITLLAGIYPAWLASHMEPVEALHGGK